MIGDDEVVASLRRIARMFAKAVEHAMGDAKCGRAWVCACAACTQAKKDARLWVDEDE